MVRLDPVVGGVLDIVAVDITVVSPIGNGVRDALDPVVAHDMSVRLFEFDALAVIASRNGVVDSLDVVVGDVPVRAARPALDAVV